MRPVVFVPLWLAAIIAPFVWLAKLGVLACYWTVIGLWLFMKWSAIALYLGCYWTGVGCYRGARWLYERWNR